MFVPAPEQVAAHDPPAAPNEAPATTTAPPSALPAPALEPGPEVSRPAPRPAPDPVEAALARADAARRRGQPAQAVSHLHRAAAVDTDPRAALAAFTIGRIELDELGRPGAARAAFERALALGLPDHLAAQARRRLEEIARAEATP
jgi:transmembrane sensor